MKTIRLDNAFSLKLLAVALASAFGTAQAADEDIDALTKPSSSVSVGVAGVSGDSKDRSLFGQYNGLREDDAYLLLDLDYLTRDEATGTWTSLQVRNLGLDTREVRAAWDRQGNWKLFGEYWELTRRYPRTVNTSLEGSGTTNPIVSLLPAPGTGSDLDLKTDRKRTTLGGEKWLGRNLLLEATFTNEDKDGARIFGRGFTCPSGAAPAGVCTPLASGTNQWAILMLPEPIDATTRQFEAKATFLGERFSVTGGYYGSFYDNHLGALVPTIAGNLNNPLGNPLGQNGSVALTTGLRNILQQPMAMYPDNEAHQFYVSGNYGFTPTTRANFKVAYTRAKQEDNFLDNGLTGAPSGRTNYGGRVDTTLAQLGLTSRPLPRLTVTANVRYEDREDKSPLDLYNIEGNNRFINGIYSLRKKAAKLEGSYLLPYNIRGTLGVDWESLNRGQFESPECLEQLDASCIGDSIAGITALRAKTDEVTYRAELRRSLSEDVTGAIGYSHSERNGSAWLKPLALPATGATALSDQEVFSRTGIFPMIFMDRKRDKVKAMVDWSPMERLSLQFSAEDGLDKYSAPTEKGLSRTGLRLFGVDAVYTLSDAWKLNAYYTYSEQRLNVAHSSGYIAELKDRNSTLGAGLKGKVSPRLQLGADLLYINDRNIYEQTLDAAASAANVAFLAQSGGLPDVVFRDTRLALFGQYSLNRNADIRVDVIYDRQKLDEWTWTTFVFSDNTTVSIQPTQNVTFVGVRYVYRWR